MGVIFLPSNTNNPNNDYDFSEFASYLYSLNGYEFTFLSVLLGYIIATPLTLNQQNSIGNFFESLGQIILTINAQEITKDALLNNTPTNKQLYKKLQELENEIKNLKNK